MRRCADLVVRRSVGDALTFDAAKRSDSSERVLFCAAQSFSRVVDIAAAAEKP